MSSVSNIALFGHAWELTVQYATPDGGTTSMVLTTNSWDPEALRMSFEVLQSTLPSPWWFADVKLYNLNIPNIQNTLLNATWVTLKAGFQTGPNLYSTIWDGPVLQTLFTRENVVDLCVTFHCVANPLVMDSIVSFAAGPFSSQLQLVARMAGEIGLPAMSTANGTVGQKAAAQMSATQYLRGRTVFGKMGKYLAEIADSNFMQTWRDGEKAYISEMSNPDTTPDLIYSPVYPPGVAVPNLPAGTTLSLIGTPQQIPQGCIFTVLLDPRLKVVLPPMVVQLERTVITQLSVIPGQTPATPLSSNLKFFVSQVRHVGDTRGNDWYTEVTGYSTTYAESLLDGVFAANAAGG